MLLCSSLETLYRGKLRHCLPEEQEKSAVDSVFRDPGDSGAVARPVRGDDTLRGNDGPEIVGPGGDSKITENDRKGREAWQVKLSPPSTRGRCRLAGTSLG